MLNKLSPRITRHTWLVPLLLAIVTLVMHHSALNAFWRFDDGWPLGFAACYAPWEYFLIPGITREINYASLTPWFPLTYDINLALFGLNRIGYYAHQLVSLWLTACMSYFLLRLWVGIGWAVFGAALFLVGAPTVHIAQELMTGHYLEGLIFASIAIYGFVRAIRGGGKHWLMLGVLGYVLACTCKEIYVPIPVLLLALPEGNWRKRLRFGAPFLAITLLYLGWRAIVLGTVIGGYQQETSVRHFVLVFGTTLLANIQLPMLLFLPNLIGYLALAALVMLLFLNTTRRGWLLVIVAAAVVLLPIAPLTIWLGILTPDRYLFALWWAVALGVAVFASRDGGPLGRTLCLVLTALIGAAAIQAGRAETKAEAVEAKTSESLYHSFDSALLMNGHNDAILPPLDISGDYVQFLYSGFLAAASNCGAPKPHPKLLSSVEAIAAIDPEKVHVYRYDTGCSCMTDVTLTIPKLLSALPRHRETPSLRTIYLPPPYRPRRDQARITDANPHGGAIERINVVGKTVEITGWARLRDDEPTQGIAFFVPAVPVKQSLASIERPEIAEHLNNPRYLHAGFRAILQFSSSANAAYTAAHLCAQKFAGGSFAPIENPANQECSGLFPQQ